MTHAKDGRGGLNYDPCRYGKSRVAFRGPQADLDGRYLACIGSTATYGRFIPDPYPTLLGQALDLPVVNFGAVNAGLDLVLHDPSVLEIALSADAVVLQAMGAQNMSNRFYAVHPRRNDRFVKASRILTALYPEVDFSQIAFTRHLLDVLYATGRERFDFVVEELQTAWTARMLRLLDQFEGRAVLFWFADMAPPDKAMMPGEARHLNEPVFVTRAMLAEAGTRALSVVQSVPKAGAGDTGTEGMVHSSFDALAAAEQIGPAGHAEAASALARALAPRLAEVGAG
ncbi:DUF6473 family protein [Litorisediminicola beolgyonensis]|uniref:DUF6473 family protein n=1 Tax=Litorisediminicola beolgyonensis TaxID=1173614 RepID=A0ABW3ZN42_9RHOB